MTTESTPPVPSIESEIDRMVALNGSRQRISVQGDRGAARITIHRNDNGEIVSSTDVLRAPTPSTGEAARLPDNGIDIQAEATHLQGRITDLEGKLGAIAGYDPRTGEPVHALPQGSKARANAEAELSQLKISTAHQLQTFARLAAQRKADAERTSSADRERTLADAYTRGDPARKAALANALRDAEATEVAAAIIQARRGK